VKLETKAIATEDSHLHILRRWFSFLGGGIAWTLHLLSIYAIGEFGCVSGLGRVMFAGVSAVAWAIIFVSILLFLLSGFSVTLAFFDMRKDSLKETRDPGNEGGEYLSRFGFILNLLFSLIIAVETMPVFWYLGGC
jgi:hypothetical protein